MSRFRITLAYDGADFVGWQRQAAGVSIQGLMEDALGEIEGSAVIVVGAGRTDAGVHAFGEVAAFTLTREIDAETLVRALNSHLPETVRVVAAEVVAPDFHPQFAARSKTYRYRIWNGHAVSPFERAYVWHVSGRLDVDAMAAAARLFEGTHDFAAFQGTGSDVKTTVRTVYESAIVDRVIADRDRRSPDHPIADALISYEITGNGFLRHMVRTIAGTLVEVGRGRRSPDSIRELIAARDRTAAGQTAPPQGLFLVRVDY